jgi:hypothetical protein
MSDSGDAAANPAQRTTKKSSWQLTDDGRRLLHMHPVPSVDASAPKQND